MSTRTFVKSLGNWLNTDLDRITGGGYVHRMSEYRIMPQTPILDNHEWPDDSNDDNLYNLLDKHGASFLEGLERKQAFFTLRLMAHAYMQGRADYSAEAITKLSDHSRKLVF